MPEIATTLVGGTLHLSWVQFQGLVEASHEVTGRGVELDVYFPFFFHASS